MIRNKKIQRALLWDIDGVLIDSEPLHIAKLKAVLKTYDIDLEDAYMTTRLNFRIPDGKGGMKDVQMQLGGAGDKNVYWWAFTRLLHKHFLPLEKENYALPEAVGFVSQQQWLDELLVFYLANANNPESPYRLKPRDHMPEMVDHLHAEDVLQGVVTSGIPKQVDENLAVLGEKRNYFFAFKLDADHVKMSKPNPEGYNKGCKRVCEIMDERGIKADAVAIVAVEDSKPGVIAALASGIGCVHFLLPDQQRMTKEELKEGLVIELKDKDLVKLAMRKYRWAETGEKVEVEAQILFEDMEKGNLSVFDLPKRAATTRDPALKTLHT